MSDYSEVFGREPETWRSPLGALRLTLAGDPERVDVKRAQHEVEELVKVLNEVSSDPAEVIAMRDQLTMELLMIGVSHPIAVAKHLIKSGWVVAPPKNEGENND